MARQISEGRKTAFYLGTGLMIVGIILFLSTFATALLWPGKLFVTFQSVAIRAFGGLALLIVGGIIRGIGARGLAGSGVVLDPERAKEELEPYARMAGGMAKDALEAANVRIGAQSERVVMIKCPSCGKLNEEDSKFCQECGKGI